MAAGRKPPKKKPKQADLSPELPVNGLPQSFQDAPHPRDKNLINRALAEGWDIPAPLRKAMVNRQLAAAIQKKSTNRDARLAFQTLLKAQEFQLRALNTGTSQTAIVLPAGSTIGEVAEVSITRPRRYELIAFAEEFLAHHLTNKPSLFHEWYRKLLATFHERREQKQSIIAPRDSAKSTWGTLIYVLYCLLYGLESYIILISDTGPQAKKFLAAIKTELEHNEKLKAAFPTLTGQGPVWQSAAIELSNGVRVECMGKGSKIRGAKHRQYRPTLIVLDDPQNLEDTYSEDQLTKDFEWLNSDVLKAGGPNCNYLVVGTALHINCIVCKLEQTPGWQHKKFKSLIAEPLNTGLWNEWRELLKRHSDPDRDIKARAFYLRNEQKMLEGAEVLWSDRYPLYALMMKKFSEGSHAFAREHQGEPLPPEAGRFLSSWFPSYRDIGDAFVLGKGYFGKDDLVLKDELYITVWVDPANRPKKSSKFTVFAAVALSADRRSFVLDVKREKLDLTQTIPQLDAFCARYRPQYVGFESNGFQMALVNECRSGSYKNIPQVKEVDPKGKSKLARAIPYIIKAEQGRVLLPEGASWRDDFLLEHDRFTGDDKYDVYTDQIDVMAYHVQDETEQVGDSGMMTA